MQVRYATYIHISWKALVASYSRIYTCIYMYIHTYIHAQQDLQLPRSQVTQAVAAREGGTHLGRPLQLHIRIFIHMHTHTCICRHVYVCIYTHMNIHTYMRNRTCNYRGVRLLKQRQRGREGRILEGPCSIFIPTKEAWRWKRRAYACFVRYTGVLNEKCVRMHALYAVQVRWMHTVMSLCIHVRRL
jgi:hypothetical protein